MYKKYWKLFIGIFLLSGLGFLTGCQANEKKQAESDKIQVMTTFYPMYEFTKQVVGDAGDVELLVPAGTDPHDYEPSARDVAKISDADFFVYNSDELEYWVQDLLDSTPDVTVIEASQDIELMAGDEADDHDHDHEGHDHSHELDPHVWLDPVLAQKQVATIRDALIEKYPQKKELFEANAQAYIEQLADLDAAYHEALDTAINRTFVTQHAAFGYLAQRYNLIQESVGGISTDQEPSPSRLAQIKAFIEEEQISVIYFESSASTKVAETIANETGVELAVLNPLESLTQTEMDAGETYISVMQANLAALQKSIN